MILEVAILDVRPGETGRFEEAFRQASPLIARQPGYHGHELRPCSESDHRYLLLAWWDSVAAHTEGFRRSAEYEQWRELLHPFYDPFPTVEHYLPPVVSGP